MPRRGVVGERLDVPAGSTDSMNGTIGAGGDRDMVHGSSAPVPANERQRALDVLVGAFMADAVIRWLNPKASRIQTSSRSWVRWTTPIRDTPSGTYPGSESTRPLQGNRVGSELMAHCLTAVD